MSQWRFAPLVKQTFVTAGVTMNMATTAMVMGFTAGLLPQLRSPDSDVQVEESTESWIAAMPGVSLLIGTALAPPMMSRFGRKISNMITIILMIIGWVLIIFANSSIVILIARFIQGLNMGATLIIGPILIAEYSSPKNRGAFLMSISMLCGVYILVIHVLGSILHWRTNSIIGLVSTVIILPIVVFSPESPTWLADKERYEESKKAFRFLRGTDEEEELTAIIKASVEANTVQVDDGARKSFVEDVRSKLSALNIIVRKREFNIPILIMIHLYALGQWGGINIISTYFNDIFDIVIGKDSDVALHIGVLDGQRIFSNILGIYIIKKIKRRTMLFLMIGLNVFAFLAIGAYVYVKSKDIFDSSVLGITLIHLHVFSIATGSLSLPFIIAGEIFPVRYKGIGGGISIIAFAVNFVLNIKTLPYLFKTIGMSGAYMLYGGVLAYCLLVAYFIMPETKDRTLQEIEDDFRGKNKYVEEMRTVDPLMSS